MLHFFLRFAQNLLPGFLQIFDFGLIALDGLFHVLFTLAYCLAFALPIAFVAHNVLQVLIGIDVFTAHNFRGIGDDIFGQTYLAGNLYSERTARIAYLQQEQCLHQMAVIEHGAVYYTFVVFGKMFQILIVCGDDTERQFLVEAFQYGFGDSASYLGFRSTTEFINQDEAPFIATFHHDFHVCKVGGIGTQIIFNGLLVTDVNEYAAEYSGMTTFVHRDE